MQHPSPVWSGHGDLPHLQSNEEVASNEPHLARDHSADEPSGVDHKLENPLTNNVGTEPVHPKKPGVVHSFFNSIVRIVHLIVPSGGILSAASSMAAGAIGAGILGLPSAADASGMVLAIIMIVIITLYSVYSMYILALTARTTNIKSFEGLARWLFPYYNYAFSAWIGFMRCFHGCMCCISYVISLGNCFVPIFDHAAQHHPDNAALHFLSTKSGNRVLTVVIWLCIMLPLVVPKHVDSLRYASTFAVAFMVFFSIAIIIHSCTNGLPINIHKVKLTDRDVATDDPDTVYMFRTGNQVIQTLGVFIFAYVCQINAMEIFWDMNPQLRTTTNYTWSATIAMLICGILYVLVTIFGYLDFGSTKLYGKSVLFMYDPLSSPLMLVAYCGVLLKICVAYAMLHTSTRNSSYYLIGWQHKYRNKRPDKKRGKRANKSPPTCQEPKETDSSAEMREMGRGGADGPNAPATSEAAKPRETEEAVMSSLKARPAVNAGEVLLEVDEDITEDTAEDTTYVDNIPFWKHLIVVLIISTAAMLCGLFIPNINTVLGLAGSISGGFIAFVCPALFFMYAGNFSVREVGWFHYLTTYSLLLSGVIGIVWGTCGTIYSTAL